MTSAILATQLALHLLTDIPFTSMKIAFDKSIRKRSFLDVSNVCYGVLALI